MDPLGYTQVDHDDFPAWLCDCPAGRQGFAGIAGFMGVSQKQGYLLGGPYKKDYSIWGPIGVPLFQETTF